ncbi:MAG: VIT1/CCC1 transporter family protein [Oscillospiraceae bacterium]
MRNEALSQDTITLLRKMQQNEVDEAQIYRRIANCVKDEHDHDVLLKISSEEDSHGKLWSKYTGLSPMPRTARVSRYALLARIFGYTFALKLMEKGEDGAGKVYANLIAELPEAELISRDEQQHESELLEILDEERLQYVGSMVLGLNDALVELTGTLAGLTFALQNNRLVALSGLITGVSATFSMTASAYLSAKSDNDPHALKSSSYTGVMYLITVMLLTFPYLILPAQAYIPALITLLVTVTLIIVVFNYYISVAKGYSFKQRFWEMFLISGSVAALSFVVGLLVKAWLGIDL